MALFIAHIQNFDGLKNKKTNSQILGITAKTFKEAEIKLHQHLFKNELAHIGEDTLDILEEISSYGDQFADLVESMKVSGSSDVEPKDFGLSKIKADQIHDFSKAKIIVHKEKAGRIRTMYISGQRMEVSELQQIGKFKQIRLENKMTYLN